MSRNLRKSLVVQGSILAVAGLISKVIGFIYRVPMANIMGNTGNGLYSVAFGIYNIVLTLSSYSMPLAVSKLMSARLAKGDIRNAGRLFQLAMLFAFCTGLTAALVLFFGAEGFAAVYRKEGLEQPLRILAPTVFVVALLGTSRGYFQGHRNMMPTAISQVIEQIVNAIVSVLAASAFVKTAASVGDDPAAYGAMGGTMGTLAGALAALTLFAVLLPAAAKREKRYLRVSRDENGEVLPDEDRKLLLKAIVLTVLPVIISQSIYQLGYTLDDLVFGNLSALKGMEATEATRLQGVFNTQYNQMINLPTAIATAMASATLPSIVASRAKGDKEGVSRKTDTVIKLNMLIAIPSAVGLAVLAEGVMGVLFPGLGDYMNVAVWLLRTGSSAVIFYALSTITTCILQGCDKMRIPVIHSGISLAIHVALVAALLYFTDLGVYALIIGNVSFPLITCLLNCIVVSRQTGYTFRVADSFIKPLLAALVMGAAACGIYRLFDDDLGQLLSLMISIVSAIFIYAAMLFVFGAVKRDELAAMPMIGRFFRRKAKT
ncbi:MAG: polysaccharide biosynthesis protein [Lachnospiraceae bacterium]|nr:polysaccharide biosynthesis protein [Lachnospiraceae bacterium]